MIILLPGKEVNRQWLESLVGPVAEALRQKVEIGDTLLVPGVSYNLKRGQYNADLILVDMPGPQPGNRHLGIIDMDIFAFNLNFVFGEADVSRRKALISLTRLKQDFYNLPDDEELFKERTLKEAVHELGHTCNINHCPNLNCVMHFSNSIRATDVKGWRFCLICQRKLDNQIK